MNYAVLTSSQRQSAAAYDAMLSMHLLLLLFRHSAKSSIAQDERLATSPGLVTRLHLRHAIAVRFHVRKINAVILTPETVGTVGV